MIRRIPGDQAARARRDQVEQHQARAAAELARRRNWPVWLYLPAIVPTIPATPSGCGCGRA